MLTTGVASAATNIVSSCSDDLTLGGTLRNTVASSAPGDTVDASSLTCSVITLMTNSTPNGPIVVNQAAGPGGFGLKIQGPGADKLAISGQNQERVFTHTGSGSLVIDGLTIEKGNVYGPYTSTPQKGGCIASYSTLILNNATVSGCAVYSTGATHALGGGIYSKGLTLSHSTVTGNTVRPTPQGPSAGTAAGEGGGIAMVGLLIVEESTISGNTAYAASGHLGFGGGVYGSGGGAIVLGSTVSNNVGYDALDLRLNTVDSALIAASTFSNNTRDAIDRRGDGKFTLSNSTLSDNGGTGLFIRQAKGSTSNIYNSTIAFNFSGTYLGQYGTANVQSTIISNNSGSDLNVASSISVSGANNLVISHGSFTYPAGFLSTNADPKLGPLQNNGGATLTRVLSPGSPAIGTGNNTEGSSEDQRGTGHPRSTSRNTTDIGAAEFDAIFWDGFEGPS